MNNLRASTMYLFSVEEIDNDGHISAVIAINSCYGTTLTGIQLL